MFELIGLIAVTAVFGFLAWGFVGMAFIPADFPAWQRLLFVAIGAAIVVGWFLLVGPHITFSIH